jgi:PAS domain-containing protein
MPDRQPLELILARNLLSTISSPAFLVGDEGRLLFFNEAAAALVGRRFEDRGTMSAAEWTSEFGPLDEHGEPLPYDEIPLTVAVREGRPGHGTFRIRSSRGSYHDVAASGVPLLGAGGTSGAIVIFWPLAEDEQGERR